MDEVPGISKLLTNEGQSTSHPLVYTRTQTFNTYLGALCESQKVVGSRLISLFHLLPGRECENPRDRIYSLRSIASDGASIAVDYDSSDKEVLFQLLGVFKNSLCPCFVAYMLQALELQDSPEILDASEQKRSLFEIKVEESFTHSGTLPKCPPECLSFVEIWDLIAQVDRDVHFYSQWGCMNSGFLKIRQFQGHDGKEKYTIKADHHQDWIEVPSISTISDFSLCERAVYYSHAIYLTAGAMISLLPTVPKEPGSKDIYRLCTNAQNPVGTDPSCKIVNSTVPQEPDPCYSDEGHGNKACIEVYQLGLSKQYIDSEIENRTWACSAIREKFLSEEAPWIPSCIRDPSSYTVFPHPFANAGTQSGPKKRKTSSSCDSMRVSRHSSCCSTACDDEVHENVSKRSYFGCLLVC